MYALIKINMIFIKGTVTTLTTGSIMIMMFILMNMCFSSYLKIANTSRLSMAFPTFFTQTVTNRLVTSFCENWLKRVHKIG